VSGNLTGSFFEDDTEDGKFTIRLFEDPVREGELKMEVNANGTSNGGGEIGGIAVRPELDKRLANALATALWAWYASDEELIASSTFDGEAY
jgi:hypothetical protein